MRRDGGWRGGWLAAITVLVALGTTLVAWADESGTRAADEAAIRAAAKAYVTALAKGDAKTVAELWTPDGTFVDDDGNVKPAGDLAAEVGRTSGQPPRPVAKVTGTTIRFLTADVAIEDGTSETALPDAKGQTPLRGHYHATWVKHDGRWRLASLCEIGAATPADARLADLDWMVGTWTAESGGAQWELVVQWNATGTFLLRDLKATTDGSVAFRGSQRIGWDPRAQTLRSWSFDSDGGFSESTWTKDGDHWVGQGIGVLPDGRQTSATTVITFDGQNSFTRQVRRGSVDGQPAAEAEVRFVRRAETK